MRAGPTRKVAETTESDNANLLALGNAVAHKGRVDGQATAEHGSDVLVLDAVGNAEDKLLVGADAARVAAVGDLAAVGVLGIVRVDLLLAVVLVVVLAPVALHARPHLRADTGAVADLELLDFGADGSDLADNLVPSDQRGDDLAPAAGDGVDVRAADTAVGLAAAGKEPRVSLGRRTGQEKGRGKLTMEISTSFSSRVLGWNSVTVAEME